jgi:hypothetical protein
MTLAGLLWFVGESTGQVPQRMGQPRHQEIESKKIAFITREISLTPEEAMVFWPVYNEYNRKRIELMNKHRQVRQQEENLEGKSERELQRIAESDIVNMEEMVSLRRAYHNEYLKILPAIKVIRLYDAERDFNRELYRESRQRLRDGRRN